MGYYLRLFSKEKVQPTARAFMNSLIKVAGFEPEIGLEGGEADWRRILIRATDGRNVCAIERNVRGADGLLEDEIEEFRELLAQSKPRGAADWVGRYLDDVQVIYAVQFLEAGFDDHARPAPSAVLWALKKVAGGIIQADNEGVSNEDGYTAVWHFLDGAEGSWNFAILDADNSWRKVSFSLDDAAKREAFLEGRL